MAQESRYLIGCIVKSRKPDCDHDENDEERQIPVGTQGIIERLNHLDSKGERHYDVAWDNGAWTVYSESEVLTDLKMIEG